MGCEDYRDADGNLHRVGGPARTLTSGDRYWYKHGQRHRVGGPAVVCSNGYREWVVLDNTHRLDGPAVTHSIDNLRRYPGMMSNQWHINGESYGLQGYCLAVWGLITTEEAPATSWRYLYNNMEG